MNVLTVTSTISNDANDDKRTGSVTTEHISKEMADQLVLAGIFHPQRLVKMPQGKAGQEIQHAAWEAWERWEAKQNQTEIPTKSRVYDRDYKPVPPKRIHTVRAKYKFIGRGKPLRQFPDEE